MSILIKEIKKSERSENLVANLVGLWEKSVRATHSFLSEEEILKIKEYVPDAICNVESLLVLFEKNEDSEKSESRPLGFMGIENKKIEMLFLSPVARGKGFGKMLVQHGIKNYSAEEVTVNEQNPKAKGFYEHLGFKTYKTSETDEQGNPYPIAWMKLEKTRRGKKLNLEKITLREYKSNDAKTVLSWLKDEYAFRQWCADRYENFPITTDDMTALYSNGDVLPFTFCIGNEIAGHFIIRYPSENRDEVRLGFVIVDDKKRGQGLGKKMIQLSLKYASENLHAKKVSLGVFENNPGALKCYKSCGFREVSQSAYTCLGEQWKSIEMEISFE